jgi:hypothetical protein
MISGAESRLIQLGGSDVRNNDNVAFIRSDQAEAARREEARIYAEQHPLVDARTAEYHREREAKAAKETVARLQQEARDLTSGVLVIATNGIRLRKLPNGQYELYDQN